MPLGGRLVVARGQWYRVQLPPASVPTHAVLALPYAGVDLVELFRPGPAGGWDVRRAGDSIPVPASRSSSACCPGNDQP